MARARIADEIGESSLVSALASPGDRTTTATAVRYLLQLLSERAPGNTVEVRVPPFGAVQAVEGPRHTRGTPPNVIEMDAATWLALATGTEEWSVALADGRVAASGSRADLTGHLPIVRMRE
jgi:Bacterial SCP ortholog